MANAFVSDAGFKGSLPADTASTNSTGIAGIFKAISDRLSAAHQRRLDAEVGKYIQEHGGQLTDDIERQISRQFGTPAGQW